MKLTIFVAIFAVSILFFAGGCSCGLSPESGPPVMQGPAPVVSKPVPSTTKTAPQAGAPKGPGPLAGITEEVASASPEAFEPNAPTLVYITRVKDDMVAGEYKPISDDDRLFVEAVKRWWSKSAAGEQSREKIDMVGRGAGMHQYIMNRINISDTDVLKYYRQNPDMFKRSDGNAEIFSFTLAREIRGRLMQRKVEETVDKIFSEQMDAGTVKFNDNLISRLSFDLESMKDLDRDAVLFEFRDARFTVADWIRQVSRQVSTGSGVAAPGGGPGSVLQTPDIAVGVRWQAKRVVIEALAAAEGTSGLSETTVERFAGLEASALVEEVLSDYRKKNTQLFSRQPISDEDARGFYALNRDKLYRTKDFYALSWLFFDNPDEAVAARAKITSGVRMEELGRREIGTGSGDALRDSTGAGAGVKLVAPAVAADSAITRKPGVESARIALDSFAPEIIMALKEMAQGDISQVIANSSGYFIVRIDAFEPGETKSFEIVRNLVGEDFHKVREKKLFDDYKRNMVTMMLREAGAGK